MPALVAHLRAEARHRWPTWLAVVVLTGVVGGLVLGSLAGARRTATAYDRLVEDTEAWDVLVNPNLGFESDLDPDDVAALPGVEASGLVNGVLVTLLDGDGAPVGSPLSLAAADDEVLVDYARPLVVEGALWDPSDPEAVMLSTDIADAAGVRPGDPLTIAVATFDAYVAWLESGSDEAPPFEPKPARLVATFEAHDTLVVDEAFDYGRMYLSPAFAEVHQPAVGFFGMAVRLADGVEVSDFRRSVQALVPGEPVEFQTEAIVEDTVERGVRPHVVALLLFAAVTGVAGLVVAAQAVGRQLVPLRDDLTALLAVGAERRAVRQLAVVRVAGLATAGGLVSLVVATAISPLFPLGVARRAEIDPGVSFDAGVLLPGAALLTLAVIGWSLLAVRRLTDVRRPTTSTPPAGTRLLDRWPGGPVVGTGLRAALAPGGPAGAPAKAAIAGLALAVGAVAATLTFGDGIDRLVGSPSAYGWNWGATIALPSDDWDEPPQVFLDRAATSEHVAERAVLSPDAVTIGGHRLPAIGIEYLQGDAGPTIIEGRRPETDAEVALGSRTMELLGVSIGDEVQAGDGHDLEVVGQAVFAGLGTYPGADRTELGRGVLVTRSALDTVGEGFGFANLNISAPDEAGLRAAIDDIVGPSPMAIEEEEVEVFDVPQRPADIQNLERVAGTPLVVAGVLSVLAGAAFAFVLVSGVRARRRELALLKTFGFRARDVAGTVAWQASATAIVALVAGIPLGIVAGRLASSVVADELGVAPTPSVPLLLAVVPVAVVLLANVVAVVPAAIAARTGAALSLRSE